MTLDPLLHSAAPIPSHAFAATAALLVGGAQLVLPKGGLRHRLFGWVWAALLGYVAASGLFIHTLRWIGPFSAIHLLSVLTLVGLWRAVACARRGDIVGHQRGMAALFVFALLMAGAFTLLPGRVMHEVIFGP